MVCFSAKLLYIGEPKMPETKQKVGSPFFGAGVGFEPAEAYARGSR